MKRNELSLKTIGSDFPASVVVFLVALPLCLGIALASDAPLFSGLIAGIVGGLIVGFLSGSHLSVSGPAAGLTAIVAAGILKLPSFETFLMAVFICGLVQIILGFIKAGILGDYVPNGVIKGMLAAIGLILILNQVPHLLGDTSQSNLDESVRQGTDSGG
nr:SulP family inorganic anion transporter [Flavisolibacter sp.]